MKSIFTVISRITSSVGHYLSDKIKLGCSYSDTPLHDVNVRSQSNNPVNQGSYIRSNDCGSLRRASDSEGDAPL